MMFVSFPTPLKNTRSRHRGFPIIMESLLFPISSDAFCSTTPTAMAIDNMT